MSLQTTINPNGLPSEVQTAYAPVAGTTIPVTTTQIALLNVAAVTMTATPTITTTDITAGTRITILQAALGTLTLQDESVLAGSKLKLASSTRTLSQSQTIVLIWTGAYWSEVSYTASGGSPGLVPYNAGIDDASIVYLLPGTGPAASTTITNNGYLNSPITVYGATQIAAIPSQWGGGSIALNGSTSYMTSLNQNSYLAAIGTGDFTYEAWLYLSAYSGGLGGVVADLRDPATGYAGLTIFVNSTGFINYWINNSSAATSTANIPLAGWHHMAVVRSAGVVTFYIDGVACGTVADGTSYISRYLSIGAQHVVGPVNFVNGYMNDFRISNIAQYTSNFAPGPAAAFPSAYNTALLPASPAAGQMAASANNIYICTNAVGPVWERAAIAPR